MILERPIKQAVGLVSLGLHRLFGPRLTSGVGILTYHRVCENPAGLPRPKWNVPPARFRQQLTGLQERGFAFTSLTHVLESSLAGETLPSKALVVTFDDAYENVFTHAFPVLCELGIPATVFVCTAYLDAAGPFPFDEWGTRFKDSAPIETFRPLTQDQCRAMMDTGLVELGAHTHTHQCFIGNPDMLRQDLQTNVDILRRDFDLEALPFAYPYGNVAKGLAGGVLTEAVRQTGVTCALTTEWHLNAPSDDPYDWGRFTAYDFDTAATLAAKIAGCYTWASRLQATICHWTLRKRPRETE